MTNMKFWPFLYILMSHKYLESKDAAKLYEMFVTRYLYHGIVYNVTISKVLKN